MKKPKETVSSVTWLMQEWDYETNFSFNIFPDKLGSQSNTYAYWKCKYGHKWKAKINNRYKGCGCPECKKSLKTSFPEQAVFFYVKQKFPDAINSFKAAFLQKMEMDIYIPSLKTGVEYDGVAWHTDNMLERERRKYRLCKQNGITLIRLKENKDHYKNASNIADRVVLVQTPFTGKSTYAPLNDAIRELLCVLFSIKFVSLHSDFLLKDSSRKNALELCPIVDIPISIDSYGDKNLIYQNYLVTKEHNSLARQFPDVAAMWHPTKNGDLTPDMFPPHSNVRLWWLGKCGHEWDSPIAVMSRGGGCPYCHGLRVLKGFNDLETVFPDIAAQWHPTKNGDLTPDMFTFGSGHKAYWLCPVCKQDWQAAINNKTHHGCPYCAHERPIKGINDLSTARPDLMRDWDYEKNKGIDPSTLMANSNKRVWWKCAKCGYEYQSCINNRAKGSGCKKCAGYILIPGKNDLQTLYPDIAAEWDQSANSGITPSQVFPNSNKLYNWVCKYGHKWRTAPNTRTSGRGCPYCSGNRVWPGFNDIATTYPKIAAEWHPTKNGDLSPTQVSKGYGKKIWFLCPVCNNAYDCYIGNKVKGFGKCPYCSSHKTRAQYVLQVETGLCFKTLKEAAKSVGIEDIRQIQMCCTGRCQTACGYHWKYVIKQPAQESNKKNNS